MHPIPSCRWHVLLWALVCQVTQLTAWKNLRVWVYTLGLCSKLCCAKLVWDVLLVQLQECWDYRQLWYQDSLFPWPICLMGQFGVENPCWWVFWWPFLAKHQIQPILEGHWVSSSKGEIVKKRIMRTHNVRAWEDVVREPRVRTCQAKRTQFIWQNKSQDDALKCP